MHAPRPWLLALAVAILAAVANGGAPAAEAAPGSLYRINGTVCATPQPSCAPLQGALVTLQPTGQLTQTSFTDGSFSLTGIRPGSYALTVSFDCTDTECYAPLNLTVADADLDVVMQVCADGEGDGMCDSWEAARPCMDENSLDDIDDPDVDFLPNIAEYDLGTNPCDSDTDDDGCSDIEELDLEFDTGGDRNPLDPADVFDVTGDQQIDLSDTVLILEHFGHGPNDEPFDNLADRWSPDSTKQWRTAFENNGIDLTDALASLSGFGTDCTPSP